MGYQVTMRPELSTMSWMLSDPLSHKVGYAQHINLLSDGSGLHMNEQVVKTHEVIQIPMVSIPVTTLFASGYVPEASWGMSYDWLTKEKED